VATLSHDLRGPLNNTQQLIELLKDRMDTDDDFTLQILNKISLSLKRGNQLIANLLDVGRIQSDGKIPIQRKNSDLISEIRDSVDMLSPAVRRRLRFVHEDDHLPGRFDTDALRRATDNLINNAVKYGEAESKITLRIMQEKYQALISVHNHGEAIPEEKLHRLFELYYRVEDSHVQKGWGLGLTLVKGIAEAHGGKVEAMSHPKDGTTFTMTIPKT
jgi:signal transduction histidine kinase